MKTYLIILLIALLVSCEDSKKASRPDPELREQATETLPPGNVQDEREALQTQNNEAPPVADHTGRYRKMVNDQPASDCNCNCIDISFDSPTEWCIIKDEVYITARCEKTGENTVDVFLVEPSREMNPDRPMPWKDFDTDTPIASITFQPDGSAQVNWKGFSTNGELATDYAIYGKKTLEGTYKRD